MQERTDDIIPVERAGTLAGLFQERQRRTPERPAYRYFDKPTEAWRALDWPCNCATVPNGWPSIWPRTIWDWCRYRCTPRIAPENAAYILGDAQCRLLLVQSAAQWRWLAPALTDLASLRRVVLLDGARSNSSARRCWDGLVGWLRGCNVECGWVFFMTKRKGAWHGTCWKHFPVDWCAVVGGL